MIIVINRKDYPLLNIKCLFEKEKCFYTKLVQVVVEQDKSIQVPGGDHNKRDVKDVIKKKL